MDVVCGRCRAEYEFDDALISERGTTVRCTNCGLQFKVFPPVGQRAPEVWKVIDVEDRERPPVEYDSLALLQQAIARGQVTSSHLLMRGEDEPRRLAEIVELQPLLRQPLSDRPPAPDASVTAPSVSPRGDRTVLGIEVRPDPSSRIARPPPAYDDANEDEEPIVPSQPPEGSETRPSQPPQSGGPSSRPRIRSALSMGPSSPGSSNPPPPSPRGARTASLAPRTSLRSTLSGIPPEVAPVEDVPPPSIASTSASRTESPKTASSETSGDSGAAMSSSSAASASPTAQEEPAISERPVSADDYAGQLTPTPTGMRAYSNVDSEPVSAIPGRPVKRRARSGWLVLAVLVGGASVFAFSAKDKLAAMVSAQAEEKPTGAVAVSEELEGKLADAETKWLAATLFASGAPASDTSSLLAKLKAAGAERSWHYVNVLRQSGAHEEARALSASVAEKEGAPLSLALLDLAESVDAPPWPSLLTRLKEASVGERHPFHARSVRVWALAGAGHLAQAEADLESLSRSAGGSQAPLVPLLEAYLKDLEKEAPSEPVAKMGAASTADSNSAEPAQPQEEPSKVEAEPTPKQPASEPAKAEPASEPAAKPKVKISAEVKAKISRADGLWRAGNKDGAVVLYQQIVSEIGTSHFLGQRSASRIRLAEREKAGQ